MGVGASLQFMVLPMTPSVQLNLTTTGRIYDPRSILQQKTWCRKWHCLRWRWTRRDHHLFRHGQRNPKTRPSMDIPHPRSNNFSHWFTSSLADQRTHANYHSYFHRVEALQKHPIQHPLPSRNNRNLSPLRPTLLSPPLLHLPRPLPLRGRWFGGWLQLLVRCWTVGVWIPI